MNREDARLAVRVGRALRTAGVLRPMSPLRARAAARAGRELHATPAASLAIAAALDPDGVAVIDDAGTVSWGALDARATAIAGTLSREHGLGAEHALAILCRNHRDLIEALAAASRVGADALLCNTEMPAAQLAQVLAAYPVGAVVCDDEFAERVAEAGGTGLDVAALAAGGGTCGPPPRRNRIVILTSGTTGVPRGAAREVPPRAMAGPFLAMVEHFGLRRGEPVLVAPPLFHGFGLGVASVAQGIGAPLILSRRFDAVAALRAIETHRAGCVVGVPVMLQRMLDAGIEVDTSSVRGFVSAGAPLPPGLARAFMDRFGDRLYNAYGTTETGFAAFATPEDLRAAPGTIGRPPYGTEVHVLDAERRPAGTGEVGHLFVGGALVFDGYAGGGSKERAGALMNTGDLGHRDAAGRLFIDGREDDMIVSGGENVFPQEVEDALAQHPAVADVAVVGVPDAEFGQRLHAFVVAAGEAPSVEVLRDWLRDRLERYKLPRAIEFCEEIPRNATGKVLRRVLVEAAS